MIRIFNSKFSVSTDRNEKNKFFEQHIKELVFYYFFTVSTTTTGSGFTISGAFVKSDNGSKLR